MSDSPSPFPWLPSGFAVGDCFAVRRVIAGGPADGEAVYQVLDAQTGGYFCTLIKTANCPAAAKDALRNMRKVGFSSVNWGKEKFAAAVFAQDDKPFILAEIFSRQTLIQSDEAKKLAHALSAINNHSWQQSLYIPCARAFLPFGKPESADERRLLVAKMLTSGDADLPMSPKQIHAINKWLTLGEISKIFGVLHIPPSGATRPPQVRPASEFVLPGQPELEAFFREDVIDYYGNWDKYQAMGVNPTGGVLLYGKPGSGKTYAVRQLADFLGWPMFDIGIGQVGSQYIHQTSVELRRKFDKAIKQAPSIIFMDEIDALGGDRSGGAQDHKVEEISELLKVVEAAVKEGVFIVAATNRPDAVDPALKRSGRFDRHLEVRYPDAKAMRAILKNCLSSRPHKAGINLQPIADALAGMPASDAELIVNEAARIASRSDKKEVDEECLDLALTKTGKRRR